MRRWEYKLIDEESVPAPGGHEAWNRELLENYLNHLGAEGWVLVHIYTYEMDGWDAFKVVLKRDRGT